MREPTRLEWMMNCRLLLWPLLLIVALITTLGLGTPSAAAASGPETRVRAIPAVTVDSVGQQSSERPGGVGCLRPAPIVLASGSCVATKAVGLTDEAAGLLGNTDDVVVLGRQADTAVAKGWDGHVVLDTPNWSLGLNDAFIQGAIDQGRTIYLASPTTGNLVQTAGQFAGQPTIYARELNMLREAGYVRVGDYMVPG